MALQTPLTWDDTRGVARKLDATDGLLIEGGLLLDGPLGFFGVKLPVTTRPSVGGHWGDSLKQLVDALVAMGLVADGRVANWEQGLTQLVALGAIGGLETGRLIVGSVAGWRNLDQPALEPGVIQALVAHSGLTETGPGTGAVVGQLAYSPVMAYGATPGAGHPLPGALWFDTTPRRLKIWSGTSWTVVDPGAFDALLNELAGLGAGQLVMSDGAGGLKALVGPTPPQSGLMPMSDASGALALVKLLNIGAAAPWANGTSAVGVPPAGGGRPAGLTHALWFNTTTGNNALSIWDESAQQWKGVPLANPLLQDLADLRTTVAAGDLFTYAGGRLTRLPLGSDGQSLTVSGGGAAWRSGFIKSALPPTTALDGDVWLDGHDGLWIRSDGAWRDLQQTERFQAANGSGGAITTGTAMVLQGGQWIPAGPATARDAAVGIAMATAAAGTPVSVAVGGLVTLDAAAWSAAIDTAEVHTPGTGLIAGRTYYVSDLQAGQITTQPAVGQELPVGTALSPTHLLLRPAAPLSHRPARAGQDAVTPAAPPSGTLWWDAANQQLLVYIAGAGTTPGDWKPVTPPAAGGGGGTPGGGGGGAPTTPSIVSVEAIDYVADPLTAGLRFTLSDATADVVHLRGAGGTKVTMSDNRTLVIDAGGSSSGSGSGSALVHVSDTAPATPDTGALWWDSASAELFIWYDSDGATSTDPGQWVQIVTPITVGAATTSVAGVVQLADGAAITAGTAGRVVDAAQLKAHAPVVADASTTAKGVVQLADAAAITAGTAGRVVDAAQLKAHTPTDATTSQKGIVQLADGAAILAAASGRVVDAQQLFDLAIHPIHPFNNNIGWCYPETGKNNIHLRLGSPNSAMVVRPDGKFSFGWDSEIFSHPIAGTIPAGHFTGSNVAISAFTGNTAPARLILNKANHYAFGTQPGDLAALAVKNRTGLGAIEITGHDGTDFHTVTARIICTLDADSVTARQIPSYWSFQVTDHGGTSPQEALRITPAGELVKKLKAPVAVGASRQITITELINGIIHVTSTTAITLDLPGGQDVKDKFSEFYVGLSFEYTIANLNSDASRTVTLSVAAVTGHTLQPASVVIPAGESARFACRITGPSTCESYALAFTRSVGGGGSVADATTAAKGVVQLADAAAITAGTSGRVVDAAQLKAHTHPDATATTKGFVQLADAAAITNATVGRVVDANQLKSHTHIDATTLAKGFVQLADAAAITAGTAGRVVDAAQLKAAQAPTSASAVGWYYPGGTAAALSLGSATAFRIDGSGRTSLGGASLFSVASWPQLQVAGDGTASRSAHASLAEFSTDTSGPVLSFLKSRGTAVGTSFGAVQSGDTLGALYWYADDGTDYGNIGASISAVAEAAATTTGNATGLRFGVNTGGTAVAEGLRITADRVICRYTPSPSQQNANATLTPADLKTGLITSNPSAGAVTLTLPTGTDLDAAFSQPAVGLSFEWSIVNAHATNTVALQAGTAGHTINPGTISVAGLNGARFLSRKAGVANWVTYRIS